jgi:hypothetical protein
VRSLATACLGPPPPPPPRGGGKRSRRGDAAGGYDDDGGAAGAASAAACFLTAFGVASTLHAAPHGGALEELLQPWSGDCCVTIDRYDVRNLLPEWQPPPACRRACACAEEEVDAAALEAERFGDLWAAEELAKSQGMRARGAARRGGLHARSGQRARQAKTRRNWRLVCVRVAAGSLVPPAAGPAASQARRACVLTAQRRRATRALCCCCGAATKGAAPFVFCVFVVLNPRRNAALRARLT